MGGETRNKRCLGNGEGILEDQGWLTKVERDRGRSTESRAEGSWGKTPFGGKVIGLGRAHRLPETQSPPCLKRIRTWDLLTFAKMRRDGVGEVLGVFIGDLNLLSPSFPSGIFCGQVREGLMLWTHCNLKTQQSDVRTASQQDRPQALLLIRATRCLL